MSSDSTSDSTMDQIASWLERGRQAQDRSDTETARRYFEMVVAQDPENVDGWLALAGLAQDRELARALYGRVLSLDPGNGEAVRATLRLRQPVAPAKAIEETPEEAPAPTAEADDPEGTHPIETDTLKASEESLAALPVASDMSAGDDQVLDQPPAPPETTDAKAPEVMRKPSEGSEPPKPPEPPQSASTHEPSQPRGHHVRNMVMLVMLLFVLVGSLGLALLAGNVRRADQVRMALGVMTATYTPTNTPTMTNTPTITPTPTLTLTPTPTSTSTPSPTSTASPTASPSPTPTRDRSWVTAKYEPLPLEEKWIEVDLSEQMLWAYEGETIVFSTLVSTGKAGTPTVTGKFRIKRKYEAQLMTGPGYYLPGVPYVQYFYASYALHGAYWHDKWGTPTSHGCVNLRNEDAQWLYEWTGPVLPEGVKIGSATKENPGTWVLIHK